MSLNTADSDKPFRFFVYVPYNQNAQPVVINVPRDAYVDELWRKVYGEVRLKDHTSQ